MNELVEKLKQLFKQIWDGLSPYIKKYTKKGRKIWKKYHVTKALVLFVLTISLFTSLYMFYLAKTANVAQLKAGLEQVTTVYDEDGEEAGTLYAQKGTFVSLDNISPNVVDALLATEDRRFYTHNGFDVIGIGRAAVGYVLKGGISGGGSTITQQLAKNAYLTLDQTLVRKMKELFLAIEIEKNYEKEEILAMYLNKSYFGNGVWGIEDASKKYFGVSAIEVTVPQAAVLVGMLKAPSSYNPIDHYDRALNRRNVVLKLMQENTILSQEEYDAFKETSIQLTDHYSSVDGYNYPYYFDAVINEASNKYGIKEEDLLNSGYKIYTSLNPTYQTQMQKSYESFSLFKQAEDGTAVQSASIAINPQTGGVEAVIGGRGEYTFRGFNRATQMKRPPGSVLKPLAVFTAALEAGYDIDSMLEDKKTSYGSDNYTPENLTKTYSETGVVPMYEAVAQSKNAPAVWLLNEIGLTRGIQKLKKFGIPIHEDDKYLGVALGGMTKGVSPLQIASAYTTFANEGVRVEPHFITKIVDATGAIVVDNTNPKRTKVTTPEVAEEMNSMLLGVYKNGTARNNQPRGYEVAGKTGSTQADFDGATNETADQWIVGYTPGIVVTSWMGFDQTTPTHHLTTNSSEGVGMLMKSELEHLLPHVHANAFAVPDAQEQVATKNQKDTLDSLKKTLRVIEEDVVKGAKKVKETTTDILKKVKEWLPR